MSIINKLSKNYSFSLSILGIIVSLLGIYVFANEFFEFQEVSLSLLTGVVSGVVASFVFYGFGNFFLKKTYLLKSLRELQEQKEEIKKISERLITKNEKLPTIFLSYSYNDKKFADKIYKALEDTNLRAISLEKSLNLGDNIKDKLESNLKLSDYFVFLISENWLKSEWSKKELDFALDQKKRIIPLIVGSPEIPSELQGIKYSKIDKENLPESLEELLKTLKIDMTKETDANI